MSHKPLKIKHNTTLKSIIETTNRAITSIKPTNINPATQKQTNTRTDRNPTTVEPTNKIAIQTPSTVQPTNEITKRPPSSIQPINKTTDRTETPVQPIIETSTSITLTTIQSSTTTPPLTSYESTHTTTKKFKDNFDFGFSVHQKSSSTRAISFETTSKGYTSFIPKNGETTAKSSKNWNGIIKDLFSVFTPEMTTSIDPFSSYDDSRNT